jgi:hypothetical protein
MGGSIHLESQFGVGSNFHFTLPLLDIPADLNGTISNDRLPLPNDDLFQAPDAHVHLYNGLLGVDQVD